MEIFARASYRDEPLPDGAEAFLRRDNPRLVELEARYRAFDVPATRHSLWTDAYLESEVALGYFRGDGAYVWQYRDLNTQDKILRTAAYIDARDAWRGLEEPGGYGAYLFEDANGRLLSRDLIDSAVEIDFLERTLGLSTRPGVNILDIGAGYGRMGLHLTRAYPKIGRVLCADGVAQSTFLAEYYLAARGAARAEAIPIDALRAALKETPVFLATNIHSFSECDLAAVTWWLDLLVAHDVPYLMVVPNADEHGGTRMLTTEPDDTQLDYRAAITERGFVCVADSPKYLEEAVQTGGVSPTRHVLFRREV